MPSSSSHSLLECRQHAIRPDAGIRPASYRGRLSGGRSRERHCHRFVVLFPYSGHRASIFLHPFAPPALPGFTATMGALTPGQSALRILIRDNERRPLRCPGLFASCAAPSRRSVSNHLLPSPGLVWFLPGAYRAACRPHPHGDHSVIWASPSIAGWPRQPAESSSSSYGPAVHLQLLSTSSCEDAVTFSYNVQTQLGKDLHLADSTHLQTHNGSPFGAKRNKSRINKPCIKLHFLRSPARDIRRAIP